MASKEDDLRQGTNVRDVSAQDFIKALAQQLRNTRVVLQHAPPHELTSTMRNT